MLVWLNGALLDARDAKVSVFDRGLLFGDGVYEVVRFFAGVGLQMSDHVARLDRSLIAARIQGVEAVVLPELCDALLSAESLRDAGVYVQVTRGASPLRSHMPTPDLRPTVFAFATPMPSLQEFDRPSPARAAIVEDVRWRRCDIKSTSLMGNVLAMLEAQEASGGAAEEAILHRGGMVAEGCSTNVLVVRGGVLATPPVDSDPPLLHGVTRLLLFAAAADLGLPVEIRPVSLDELRTADEVMISSSRRILSPVTHLDGEPFRGAAGPVCAQLFAAARRRIARECGVALEEPGASPESDDGRSTPQPAPPVGIAS